MATKPEQRAAFISSDGMTLSTHTMKDFHKIKPKEKKVPKPKRTTLTPFEEIIEYERAIRMRARIKEENVVLDDKDGNMCIIEDGRMSIVGGEFDWDSANPIDTIHRQLPPIPRLSTKAYYLYMKQEKDKSERGPVHGPPFTHADQFDFLGNPLKPLSE